MSGIRRQEGKNILKVLLPPQQLVPQQSSEEEHAPLTIERGTEDPTTFFKVNRQHKEKDLQSLISGREAEDRLCPSVRGNKDPNLDFSEKLISRGKFPLERKSSEFIMITIIIMMIMIMMIMIMIIIIVWGRLLNQDRPQVGGDLHHPCGFHHEMQDVHPGGEWFSSHLNCRDFSFFWATRGLC